MNRLIKLVFINVIFFSFILTSVSIRSEVNSSEHILIHTPIPKIIGGSLVEPGNWPFMAALSFKDVSPIYGQFCGASLIKSNWILTAAHCVAELGAEEVDVVIGRNQLSLSSGEIIPVSEIVVHKYYNPVTFDFDIALLKLERDASVEAIQTLGRFSTQDKKDGKPATVLGWGDTSTNSRFFPDFLHQVALPIVPNENCNPQTAGVTDNMLCLGVLNGSKDSCKGDSGGPAFILDPESNKLRQIGIVSFGFGCARPGFVGVYTRVSEFSTFISDTVCSAEETPGIPGLEITVEGNTVTASWNEVANAEGYRLNYAPYPDMEPIESLDLNQQTEMTVTLPSGSAFFVAVNAYNLNCRGGYSEIKDFKLP